MTKWSNISSACIPNHDVVYRISSESYRYVSYAHIVLHYLYGIELSWHDDEFYGKFLSHLIVWYGYRYGTCIHRICLGEYEKMI